MDDIIIRKVKISDAKMLLPLAEQIGYPVSLPIAKKRLAQIVKRKEDIFLVAEKDQKVIGFVHGLEIFELLTAKTLRLAGVIVDKNVRQKGIGRSLMVELERWAEKHDYRMIIVPSNTKRRGAAKFYPKIGYPKVKNQNVFIKNL
jgi:N-acetylglutamate synthase-like GNAT family acetyltransferase